MEELLKEYKKRLNNIVVIDKKETTVNNILKNILRYILIDNPPKRINGSSEWLNDLELAMTQAGIIKGGTHPCCEVKHWCDGNEPCGYNHHATDEEVIEIINEMLEKIFK